MIYYILEGFRMIQNASEDSRMLAVWSSISIHYNFKLFQFITISIYFNSFIENTQFISNMY